MTPEALRRQFDVMADAPNGVRNLRELILQLAVRGKLVPQDPSDEPASVLLQRIAAERDRLVAEGKIGKPRVLPPIGEDEVPFGVPEGWVWLRLHEVFIHITDGDHQPPPQSVSGIPFLVISNVSSGAINFASTRFVPEGYFAALGEFRRPRRGNILYTVTGSFGIPILVEDDRAFCVQRHIAILTPALNSDAHFLCHLLGSTVVRQQAIQQATGTAQKTVSLGALRAILVPLPPLAEQHRIVAKVGELMALCDEFEARQQRRADARVRLNRSVLHHLTEASDDAELAAHWERLRENFHLIYDTPESVAELRQAVLQLAVRGKLVPQDPGDEPASVLLERIAAERDRLVAEGRIRKPKALPPIGEDEVPFGVPEGWVWVRLRTISDQRLGKMLDSSKNKGEPYPYLRNTNVQWLRFDLDDVKEMRFRPDEVDEYALRAGDLLICEGGEPGRCAVWSGSSGHMMFQKALHRVRPYGGIDVRYILHNLRARSFSGELNQYFTGATIKHLTGQSLSQIPLPLPPLAEQHRIVARVDELMALCDELEARLTRARESSARLAESVVHQLTAA